MSTDFDLSRLGGEDFPPDLIERYWLRVASPAEVAHVDAWYQRHPEMRAAHAAFRAELEFRFPGESADGWEREADRHLEVVLRSGSRQAPAGVVGESGGAAHSATVRKVFRGLPAPRLRTPGLRRVVGLGGVLAAVMLAIGLGLWSSRRVPPTPVAEAVRDTSFTTVATARGQRATVELADGSRVILSVDSRMRYARDFGKRSREIVLEGEAYFDVVHDARVPFRVRTAHGIAEDVGTRFAVRAYAGESAARVIVEEGLVAVGHGVTLAGGDLARITADAPPLVRHGAPVQALLAWTHGELRFMDVPLRDVIADVRRWYDIPVELGDASLGPSGVTASFGKEPVQEVLEFLARAVGARLERRGGGWTFIPRSRMTPRQAP